MAKKIDPRTGDGGVEVRKKKRGPIAGTSRARAAETRAAVKAATRNAEERERRAAIAAAGEARCRASAGVHDFFRKTEGMTRGVLRRFLAEERTRLKMADPPRDASIDSQWRAVAYRLQVEGFEHEGIPLAERTRKNAEAAATYAGAEAFGYADVLRVTEGDDEMATKAKKSTAAAKGAARGERRTIQSAVVDLLRLAKPPDDEEVARRILKEFPGAKFKAIHMNWYKTQFRHGRLSGQTGPEKIAGEEGKKRRAPAKKAKGGRKAAPKKRATKARSTSKKESAGA
jgi:hypothetical protein